MCIVAEIVAAAAAVVVIVGGGGGASGSGEVAVAAPVTAVGCTKQAVVNQRQTKKSWTEQLNQQTPYDPSPQTVPCPASRRPNPKS